MTHRHASGTAESVDDDGRLELVVAEGERQLEETLRRGSAKRVAVVQKHLAACISAGVKGDDQPVRPRAHLGDRLRRDVVLGWQDGASADVKLQLDRPRDVKALRARSDVGTGKIVVPNGVSGEVGGEARGALSERRADEEVRAEKKLRVDLGGDRVVRELKK